MVLSAQKQLIVDGRQLGGTVEAGHKQATVQILSVRAGKERTCLAQSQIAAKTNQIKAIPDLLKPLDITGRVVTIDAVGCQKTIAELIITQKADYVIGLKASQDGLYEQVSEWVAPFVTTGVLRINSTGSWMLLLRKMVAEFVRTTLGAL